MTAENNASEGSEMTSNVTSATTSESVRLNSQDGVQIPYGQSDSPKHDVTGKGETGHPVTVTPPRDSEFEESLEQSPLDGAIRRRLVFRSKSGKGAASEKLGKRRSSSSEVQGNTSAATLRPSGSLGLVYDKISEPDVNVEPASPASTKIDGRFSEQHFRTPTTKSKGKFPQHGSEKIEQESPGTSRQSDEAEVPKNFIYPRVDATDPRRALGNRNLFAQRAVFGSIVLAMNIACLIGALKSDRHIWILIIILVVKAKDVLSTIAQVGWIPVLFFRKRKKEAPDISGKWILACITAYAETEEQIMRTINSVVDNAPRQHHLVMVIVLDGKPQKILRHFSKVVEIIHRPYRTWRYAHNELNVYTGVIRDIPIIMFEKIGNAGKKDSLLLCHDLFNHMRENAPEPTKELRTEVWTRLLPWIIPINTPEKFDFLFFTDADSLVHEDALSHLVQALTEEPDSIAACGLVLAEMIPGNAWSMWYLYQEFQYTFGQFVRRRAEGIWGRVTCLPGCITMIKNRPEMAGAAALFAHPITDRLVFQHQVQYLGTDRRMTWCMLEQSPHLKTLFVPKATSETVAPQGLRHYMSQRRRWGSNAYFNDIMYIFGRNSWLVTRLWSFVDVVRQTLVYYRLANTIMFIYGLSRHFLIIKLVPYLVVTQMPVIWFCLVVAHEPILRKQAHKLFVGWLINKFVSPIFAIMIFSRILLNLGNATWGRTGVSTHAMSALDILHSLTPKRSWTPAHITTLVRETIKERTKRIHRTKSKLVAPKYNGQQKPLASTLDTQIIRLKVESETGSSIPTSPLRAHVSDENAGNQDGVRKHKIMKLKER